MSTTTATRLMPPKNKSKTKGPAKLRSAADILDALPKLEEIKRGTSDISEAWVQELFQRARQVEINLLSQRSDLRDEFNRVDELRTLAQKMRGPLRLFAHQAPAEYLVLQAAVSELSRKADLLAVACLEHEDKEGRL